MNACRIERAIVCAIVAKAVSARHCEARSVEPLGEPGNIAPANCLGATGSVIGAGGATAEILLNLVLCVAGQRQVAAVLVRGNVIERPAGDDSADGSVADVQESLPMTVHILFRHW